MGVKKRRDGISRQESIIPLYFRFFFVHLILNSLSISLLRFHNSVINAAFSILYHDFGDRFI